MFNFLGFYGITHTVPRHSLQYFIFLCKTVGVHLYGENNVVSSETFFLTCITKCVLCWSILQLIIQPVEVLCLHVKLMTHFLISV